MIQMRPAAFSSTFELFRESTESRKEPAVQWMRGLVESNFTEESNEALEDLAYKHQQEE